MSSVKPDISTSVKGFQLQESPAIYVAAISGNWLLDHTTPVWRMKDPVKGFQRIVKEDRAEEIAATVLDQHRTFPNSIVLATDVRHLKAEGAELVIPAKISFLIVDGQHRLWAQRYSKFDAKYCCMLHMGLSGPEMAKLFLEINDTQKRVPSSLRWDLVRLIKPHERQNDVTASELTFELATRRESALFQRIDLTGEQPEITLNQGSVAPEIKTLVTKKTSPLKGADFESQFDILNRYFAAIKSRDPDKWKKAESRLYQARVIRVLLRLLPEIIQDLGSRPEELTPQSYKPYLDQIKLETLDMSEIRAAQGTSGLAVIYSLIKKQMKL